MSGWWRIDKRHIRSGVIFALHEHRVDKSYLQGEIEGIEEERERASPKGKVTTKISIRVRKLNTGIDWAGEGVYEKSFVWSPHAAGR